MRGRDTDRRTERQTDKQTDRQTGRQTKYRQAVKIDTPTAI